MTTVRPTNRGGWRRKHDDPNGPAYIAAGRLRGHYVPHSLAELVQIVADASTDAMPCVRACGSHWSLSEAVCDPCYTGRIVETQRLNKTLYHVIPSCLSEPVRESLFSQPSLPAHAWNEDLYALYHVEAGICIHDLYLRLDGQDPRWPLPTDEWNVASLRGPWAMPTMAAAGGQTIAGAISTSTHGSDIHLPPIADMVQAVHLVGAGGHQFWIERGQFGRRVQGPMCDPGKLQAALTCDGNNHVHVIQDDTFLNAVIVSLGRMGIIYSVVLKVVQAYGLAETRYRRCWDEVQQELVDPSSSLFSQRFVAIVVNPFPRNRSQRHTCWITQRQAIPLSRVTRAYRAGFPEPTGNELPRSRHTHPLLARICASRADIGNVIGKTMNRLASSGHGWLVAWLIESFLALEQAEIRAEKPLRDVSYAISDRHNYADRSCVTSGDAFEVAFDANGDLPVRFVNESVFVRTKQLLEGRLTGTPMIGATYVSIRFTGRTQALLGIQRWERTCLIAIAGLRRFAGLAPLLDALEADALDLGGVVHWGQRNHLTRAQVARSYPDLPTWRRILRRLSAFGPAHTFSTAYTRRAGLEP